MIGFKCNFQASVAEDDDDDDVDLFGEETEEEKKAAEERAAAVKASGKKKECKFYNHAWYPPRPLNNLKFITGVLL